MPFSTPTPQDLDLIIVGFFALGILGCSLLHRYVEGRELKRYRESKEYNSW